MAEILQDMEGVICHMDDILVHARTHEEHRQCLQNVLLCLQETGLTLNAEKCQFFQTEVKFLGQIIDGNGIRPDPGKIAAINVSEPKCVTDVRRFLGMTNQMSKFLTGLADKTQPSRELLKSNTQWIGEDPRKEAFTSVKAAMCHSQLLAMFDPK